jgi:hypothetical protein
MLVLLSAPHAGQVPVGKVCGIPEESLNARVDVGELAVLFAGFNAWPIAWWSLSRLKVVTLPPEPDDSEVE